MDEPVAFFTGGGPASGKDSFVEGLQARWGNVLAYIDPDKFKFKMPEYSQMMSTDDEEKAAGHVHEESSYLAKEALRRAIASGRPFLFDSVLKNVPYLTETMGTLKAKGYFIEIRFMDCPPEETARRAKKRGKETGRHVNDDEVRESNTKAVRGLHALKHLADTVRVYSSYKTPDNKPLLVYEIIDGQVKIHQPDRVDELRARGHQM